MEARCSYRNTECGKQETWTSNILNTEDQLVLSVVILVLLHRQHQKAKIIFWKLRAYDFKSAKTAGKFKAGATDKLQTDSYVDIFRKR